MNPRPALRGYFLIVPLTYLMTTATATKTSTYHITVPVPAYLMGTIEAPSGLSNDEVLKLITWETTANFEGPDSFKDLRVAAMEAIEEGPNSVGDIEEEPND